MNSDSNKDLLDRLQTMQVDRRHDRRSPHKPLLLLLSIGRHFSGYDRLATFSEIEADMSRLIRRFGLPVSQLNPHYPFWRLRNDDGLWEIDRANLVRETGSGDPLVSSLRDDRIRGGLPREFIDSLDASPELTWSVIRNLLSDYFPPSLHEDLLLDVGLGDRVAYSESIFTKSRPRRGATTSGRKCCWHTRGGVQSVSLTCRSTMRRLELRQLISDGILPMGLPLSGMV